MMIMITTITIIMTNSLPYNNISLKSTSLSILYIFHLTFFLFVQGGVKAVVYADSLQAVVMLIGVLAIVIQGAVAFGGLGEVFDIAYHGERIEFFK